MRAHGLVLLALLPVAAPAAAGTGVDFVPGWFARGEWTSNVFRTETQEENGWSITTGPDLRFQKQQGDLTFDLTYLPRYEAWLNISDINEFEHFASLEGRWQITRRTSLEVSDDFTDSASLGGLFFFEDGVTGVSPADAVIVPRRERIRRNVSRVELEHRLTPLWRLSFLGNGQFVDFDNESQTTSRSFAGSGQLTRSLSPRMIAGFGASITQQNFDEGGETPSRGSTFYQGFAVWEYQVTRNFYVAAQAGPAWTSPETVSEDSAQVATIPGIRFRSNGRTVSAAVDPTTCPTRDGVPVFSNTECDVAFFRDADGELIEPLRAAGGDATPVEVPFDSGGGVGGSLTYFGSLSLNNDWTEHWRTRLAYTRSASNSSGIGTSTIVDTLNGRVEWRPTQRWNVALSAVWTRQTAASPIRQPQVLLEPTLNCAGAIGVTSCPDALPRTTIGLPIGVTTGDEIDNAIDVVSYRVQLDASRRITENLSVDGSASWWRQESEGTLSVPTARAVYRVDLGFTWRFDPIPL